ncbi:NACHT, LRR and PYD domains-containing protein 12 [Ictalurus furcatus]|uniref:NACHT, LRR and PYD domains-containing protein 12 n=1 Tax=Ictalurus furcatus TaxID=66913 RepID=UPI002350C180|nr:NACHT, LRR and PYD domains-containing protein 12 [Ictalurus furcatus]XP_053499494.1 NACHT, LRR and PYD domains-containing protein 12 [Ictalurus furcatus]XP_053499495.1 NACHT, LRR and PYD domains-containing protein 12 [Ictalurus furcatus]
MNHCGESAPKVPRLDKLDGPSCLSVKSSNSMLEPIAFKKAASLIQGTTCQSSLPEPVISTTKDIYKDQRNHAAGFAKSDSPAVTEVKLHYEHKNRLKAKFQNIYHELTIPGQATFLNDVYTELYITESDSGNVRMEHEVRQIEMISRTQTRVEIPIKCNDIFKPIHGHGKPIRSVLTKGVAGIGKTVSVQKFVLDWAEGKANQDIGFIYPLAFRELNLMKGERFSLIKLLQCFTMGTLEATDPQSRKVLFVLDGLDECRFPLDFQNNRRVSDAAEHVSLDVLLTNLINGNLLPDALLWITSRPAAANQIPPQCIDLVSEVRGFNDPQKEEYLRKRISDKKLASRIIAHIKSSRSLFIMCHIPVFCWLSSAVLERTISSLDGEEVPKTLTQMYIHFLLIQTRTKNHRYSDRNEGPSDDDMIVKLGKLAFQQLEKGNLIFYEDDLRTCGIDVKEAVVYSGVCSQIFKEECALTQSKVYCFVHLSIQEFLAAVYVFLMCKCKNWNVLDQTSCTTTDATQALIDMHRNAIDRALKSENGHLDLFLRFLLGLSLESNQTLLHSLLPQVGPSLQNTEATVEYIKMKIEENSSTEKSVNLFYCLNELNELSIVKEVQRYLSSESSSKLSLAQWSALVFVLLTSETKLDVFDLKKYIRSDEGLVRLMLVVKASEIALLDNCGLTERCCKALGSALSLDSSNLRELNLSGNSIGDTGLRLLTEGLGNVKSKLKKLSLSYCRITPQGCFTMASQLLPRLPHLKVLDLSENSLRQTGIQSLATHLKNPECKLETLRLKDCRVTPEGSRALASALILNPSHLKELDLHWNNPGDDPGVEQLAAVMRDPLSKLEVLWLSYGLLTEKTCEALASVLSCSAAHLKAVDLSGNSIQDTGVELLSAGLRSPHCKLEILRLAFCDITEGGATALASALTANPITLKELDLSENPVGDCGLKALSNVIRDFNCRLHTLRLRQSGVTEDGCAALASALSSNPSCLRELNLGNNKLTEAAIKSLCDVLDNGIFQLELNECCLTESCCGSLASVLLKECSSLKVLNLGGNNLQDSGVKTLCGGLGSPNCKLEMLRLFNCGVSEKGCEFLASVLSGKHSVLKELDLSGNNLKDTDTKLLNVLIEDPSNKLDQLNLY